MFFGTSSISFNSRRINGDLLFNFVRDVKLYCHIDDVVNEALLMESGYMMD